MHNKLIRQVKLYFGRYGSRVGHAFHDDLLLMQRLYKGDFALIFLLLR